MSCSGMEVDTPFGTICIPMVEPNKWPPDEPDPRRKLWDDLATLVTINQRISRLSDRRMRENLSHAVQGAAKSLPLPKGVRLGDRLFGEKPLVAAREAADMEA